MSQHAQKLIIHGTTLAGRRFRPSDWAERLAGVMSQFRPEGSSGGPMTYSPYVVPRVIDGVRCVVVDHRLRDIFPLAWQFVCDFATDNELRTSCRGDDDSQIGSEDGDPKDGISRAVVPPAEVKP